MELKALKVKPRGLSTKGHVNSIRRNGGIPAVYYGFNVEPSNFEVSSVEFRGVWGPGKRNSVLDLQLEGQSAPVPAVVYDVQKDPISGEVTHIDFKAVKPGEKVKVYIPVRLVGTPVGVKTEGGQLFQLTKRIRINVLPEDIPSHYELDVSDFHAEHVHYVNMINLNGAEIVSSGKAVLFYIQKGRKK